jgi:hypothetical protein
MIGYAEVQKSFPGYRGNVQPKTPDRTKVPAPAPWAIAVFPYMEEDQKTKEWALNIYAANPYGTNGVFTLYNRIEGGGVSVFICPSDPLSASNGLSNLSYGVNTGQNARVPSSTAASASLTTFISNRAEEGVCLDHYVNPLVKPPLKGIPSRVSIDYVSSHDGTTSTILMGENNNNTYRNNAGKGRYWNIIEGTTPYNNADSIALTAENLGINWYGNSPIPPTFTPLPTGYVANKYQTTEKISSYHPGIVIVTFCDGSTHDLRNDIEPNVLARLMMPFDRGKYAANMAATPTLVDTKGLMPLTDSDYR